MFRKSHSIDHKVFLEPYRFEIFTPQIEGPKPVIFQTPILGQLAFFEDLFWERRWTRFFAEQGFISVLIDRPIFEFHPDRGLEQIQEYLENSLKRNQAVLERVFHDKLGDPNHAGSYGISMGSIINCLWACQEKKLRVNAFSLPGANLPEIFMESRDSLMVDYRNAALACCGNDSEQLKENLKKLFTKDPLTLCTPAPDTTLLVLARKDCVVPFKNGMMLREKLGNPKTIYLPFGHYLSMFTTINLKWKVVRFFKEKFGLADFKP